MLLAAAQHHNNSHNKNSRSERFTSMPNDKEPKAPPETLEELFEEAETQLQTPVVDQPRPCQHVDGVYNVASDPDVHKCPTCLWDFCPDCASILDPRYCRLCVSEATAELIQEPLIDTEGHTVENGRRLTPAPTATYYQPRQGTLARQISEMSDSELEEHIKQYTELVRQAETVLDFRRIHLGSSKMEVTQRDDIKRRRLRADKTKFPVHTVTIDKKTGQRVTKAVPTAAKLDMIKMIDAIRLMEANRVAAAKAKLKADADAAAKAVDKKMKEPHL
jgi:hypothetical protein